MKTIITLPDHYHKELKKIAIERSTTLTSLIWETLKEKFFSDSSKNDNTISRQLPLNQLKGILSQHKSSEHDINQLKQIWDKKS